MNKFTQMAGVALLSASLIAPLLHASEGVAAQPFSVAADNGVLELQAFRGKVVYLDFWASWCGPCRASFKWLDGMQAKYADRGLEVIAINLDTERELAARFLSENPVSFRIGYDPDGKVAAQYQLKGMPSSYLIDGQGNIRGTHVGFRGKDQESLEAELLRLLGEQQNNVALQQHKVE